MKGFSGRRIRDTRRKNKLDFDKIVLAQYSQIGALYVKYYRRFYRRRNGCMSNESREDAKFFCI